MGTQHPVATTEPPSTPPTGHTEGGDSTAGSWLSPYIQIARPDHWFKNVFVLPGIALGLLMSGRGLAAPVWPSIAALVATCMIASANYTINEFLDAEYDRHHPVKKDRSSAKGLVKARSVALQYLLLTVVGLGLAVSINPLLLASCALLLFMGIIYNVRPMRSKDRVYLDVVSESVNNPIRLLIGWSVVIQDGLPPSSIMLAYWFGGAFLMAMKRYSEYQSIGDPAIAGQYRRSFRFYTPEKLLISSFFYALNSAFFLGIFLIKYRLEFILSFPLFSLLFAWYLAIALRQGSVAQTPEKLYRERGFVLFNFILVLVVTGLLLFDIPALRFLGNHETVSIEGLLGH